MNDRSQRDPAVIALFSEIVMVETLAKNRLTRVLPSGMELSHFMVLNHFAVGVAASSKVPVATTARAACRLSHVEPMSRRRDVSDSSASWRTTAESWPQTMASAARLATTLKRSMAP